MGTSRAATKRRREDHWRKQREKREENHRLMLTWRPKRGISLAWIGVMYLAVGAFWIIAALYVVGVI